MMEDHAGAPSRASNHGLAPSPEASWIGALLDAARAGLEAGRARAGRSGTPDLAEDGITVGPGDDAAVISVPEGTNVVVSSDASVEGIHFRRAWMTWETIGYRAAASALSDLAAMAASPIGLTLSAALPPELDAGAAAAIGRGVGEALAVSGGRVLGGDLVASPGPVMLDVTVLGHASDPVTRAGARVGDEVWVTGCLGGAAAAVADLQAGLEPLPEARGAFERPRARVAEAIWLAERVGPTAMIDLSDGLARDGRHLSAASGVQVEIELVAVPVHPAVRPYIDSAVGPKLLLSGGEDYELLFAAGVGDVAGIVDEFVSRFGIDLSKIGHVSDGAGLRVTYPPEHPGGPLPGSVADGFDHFGGGVS